MTVMLRQATSWARVFTFAILIAIHAVKGGEPPCYKELNHHEFFRRWVILSPLPVLSGATNAVTEEVQKQAFAFDHLTWDGGESGVQPKDGTTIKVNNQDFQWQLVESATDEINLLSPGKSSDFSIAYAWARIEMPEAQSALLGLGSDDAVKVWLNGKMIHENWIMRSLTQDQDILRLDLAKGTNTLLLKIQNGQGDWGFACRFIDAKTRVEKLVLAAGSGDLDKAKLLVSQGTDVNGRWQELTPLQAARIAGEREMADFLIGNGADASVPMPEPEKIIDSILSGKAILTITRENNRLFAQPTGQAKLEIFPKSADTFFLKAVEAEVQFVKNDKGEVVKAILKQSGIATDAVRLSEEK